MDISTIGVRDFNILSIINRIKEEKNQQRYRQFEHNKFHLMDRIRFSIRQF